ncbi:MAG: hypothetical protein HYW86_04115 [Candidatus Roizmanbacteria bacterium]|nr:MAG: hypothetical protein HYW86_04115 [Candidatus Roizmanbacteria bacterium]
MAIRPVFEKEANEEIKNLYRKLKEALKLDSLPLFFAYLGAFPEYFRYIAQQIDNLAKNHEFNKLCGETATEIEKELTEKLTISEELENWLNRYKYSPAFYNFQKDLQHIFLSNVKLTFIFIALREAVKGWAVASKKLSGEVKINAQTAKETPQEDFVFDDTYAKNYSIEARKGEIAAAGESALEKDLLPEYLVLCRRDFIDVLKNEDFLRLRVQIEQKFLNDLALLPESIYSPINVVLQYTSKYPDFPDLLYLLTEHFPTYAVQRMLFSGYMIKG